VRAKRILVVDDSESQRDVVEEVLSAAGYEVRVAATGQEALELARAAPPDLLLLDLMLPDIDGGTVLAALRREPGMDALRVLVTTGVRSSSVRRLVGADATLFKPFGPRELITSIADMLPA
jgi:CheY-like chemotaxis protein